MKGMFGLRSALSLAIGVGSAITGSYLVSRVKEKQEVESRIDRLEAVVEKLATTVSESQGESAKAAPRRTTKSAKEPKK
jgi:outer membrane murein-binding lipoprotein Lpp